MWKQHLLLPYSGIFFSFCLKDIVFLFFLTDELMILLKFFLVAL